METKTNALKTMIALIIVFLFGCKSAYAEKKAWAEFDSSTGCLSFYYTDKDALGNNEFEMNKGTEAPGWYDIRENITKVKIDETFAQARPTSCHYWFRGIKAEQIEGLEYLNTSAVTDMSYMFCSSALKMLDLSKFNTSNVTDMKAMFGYCESLTSVNVSKFNTSNVTNMAAMFCDCPLLKSLELSNFDTSNVTDMNAMFFHCDALTSLDLSNFNTSKVKNMYEMFMTCKGLTTLDLSSFNTQNVTNMYGMFDNCTALTTLYLSNFNTSKVTTMEYMFDNCTSLTTIFVSTAFDVSNVGKSDYMFTNCPNLKGDKEFDETHTDKTYARIDDGYLCGVQYIRPWVELADGSLTFQYGYKKTLSATEYLLNEGENRPEWHDNYNDITKVVFDSSFAEARPTSCFGWFEGFQYLKTIEGIEYLNTSEVTSMGNMFAACKILESLDLSTFDTHNTTNMYAMFWDCQKLETLNLSSFNTHNVTNMNAMFWDCQKLGTLDLSTFDTQNVESMYLMFDNCKNLTSLDLSSFDTRKVKDMAYMFGECSSLTSLDLSNFDTQNVTAMQNMFLSCSKLNTIYLGDEFKVITDENLLLNQCPATIYCTPLVYNSTKSKLSNIVKAYVDINPKATYGTLCVPVGSTLAEGSFSGFDKLYTIKSINTESGTITMGEVEKIKPGVAYVYRRNLPEAATKSIITFDADASATVTTPNADGSILIGTFKRIIAPDGCYILQSDGNFHPVAAGNTTIAVGTYRAYLQLPGFDVTGGIEEAKAYKMTFEDNQTTAINGIADKADYQQPNAYFDLMGRKVSAPNKGGIYIVNGKKVVYSK